MTLKVHANTKEGWGRPWGCAFRHYIRNSKSLCGRIRCFRGNLSKDISDDGDNCSVCERVMQAELTNNE